MSKSDGSITFVTALDNKQLEKDLQKTTRRIEELEAKIKTAGHRRMPLLEQSKELSRHLDKAKAKLDAMKNAAAGSFSKEQIAEQAETVQALQTRWNEIQSEVKKYDNVIKNSTLKLDEAKETAGQLAQELAEASTNSRLMDDVVEDVGKRMDRFNLRFKEVIRGALVFTLVSQALSKFRDWMGKVIRTNDEATAAVARLKGALLTLAQPLVEVIIPAFATLVNILARVISIVAQLVSFLFGKTAKQSSAAAEALNEETEALEGVGSAAEDAAGSLAGFDEINTINTETSGGGGSGSSPIEPDFDLGEQLSESQLSNLLELVKGIGAAFLGWRIGKALGLDLGQILGLVLAIYSAFTFVQNLTDAWANGVSWDNLLGMLLGLAGAAVGLYIAFGPVAAGIALVVGGLAMLATGFHDAFEQGWTLQNLLLSVAGIIATGLGISLLVRGKAALIPALIAGFASALLAITVFFGDGEALIESLQQIIEGFSEFFTAVFTGDMEGAAAALSKIWDGIKATASIVWDAMKNAASVFGTWFVDWANQKYADFIRKCEEWGDNLEGWWDGLWDGVKKRWDDFWSGVDRKVASLTNLGRSIVNNIKQGISNAWSGLTSWFNNLWNNLFGNRKVSATVTGASTGSYPSVASYSVPALATGAVIPPNREFLAVLGDQTSGNNIEAPESLIRKIVREEAGGMNTELLEAILEAIRAGQVIKVGERVFGETAVRTINNVTRSAGKSVLLV